MIDLEELERLQKLAEPLPWKEDLYLTSDGDSVDAVSNIDGDMIVHTDESLLAEAFNCAYIASACNAVPELIARVRELERQRNKLLGMYCNEMVCSWCWLDVVCPHFDETIVRRNPNSEGCRETLRKWLEEAAKEAGE
ncbi:MAG: hypothetical protein IKW19_03665 [Akkermansia sp.]|nr:hypothetical protein [Akkermansia sp.]